MAYIETCWLPFITYKSVVNRHFERFIWPHMVLYLPGTRFFFNDNVSHTEVFVVSRIAKQY